jgi:hypothetical protein
MKMAIVCQGNTTDIASTAALVALAVNDKVNGISSCGAGINQIVA